VWSCARVRSVAAMSWVMVSPAGAGLLQGAEDRFGVDVSGDSPPHRLLTRALQQLLELLVEVGLAAGDGVLDPVGRGAYPREAAADRVAFGVVVVLALQVGHDPAGRGDELRAGRDQVHELGAVLHAL
jgi:hypothetical protein